MLEGTRKRGFASHCQTGVNKKTAESGADIRLNRILPVRADFRMLRRQLGKPGIGKALLVKGVVPPVPKVTMNAIPHFRLIAPQGLSGGIFGHSLFNPRKAGLIRHKAFWPCESPWSPHCPGRTFAGTDSGLGLPQDFIGGNHVALEGFETD
jgi:hypothetical protein